MFTSNKIRLLLLFILIISSNCFAEIVGFKTISGNIYCQFFNDNAAKSLRCDITKYNNSPPIKPKDCEFDWGQGFGITSNSKKGERLCISDSVMDSSLPTLQYGTRWQHEGFTCKSEKRGLTCFNSGNHGFLISKQYQRLF
jgi:hypothetical protein